MEANMTSLSPDMAVAHNLRRSKGWMMFVGIVMMIFAGLWVLVSLLILTSVPREIGEESGAARILVIVSITSIVVSALMIWAGIVLVQTASQAGFAEAATVSKALVGYTAGLRKFFLLMGINMIIGFTIAVLWLVSKITH